MTKWDVSKMFKIMLLSQVIKGLLLSVTIKCKRMLSIIKMGIVTIHTRAII